MTDQPKDQPKTTAAKGDERLQPTDAQIQAMCRPPALRFSKDMVEFANKKFEGYAPFWAPLVAAFTMQNVLMVSMIENYAPGSEEGLKAINTFFDKCKFEAAAHWRNPKFIEQFGERKKPSLVIAP